MAILKRIIHSFLKNKYIATLLAFVVWVVFFDKNDLITQYRYWAELQDLKAKKAYLLEEIAQTEQERLELLSSPEKLEKFAREKYLMKKDEEDLFVIVEKPGKK